MKKLISVLLLACMLVMPFAAMAEADVDVKIVNWEDYEAVTAEVEGEFVSSEAWGVKFWLPSYFQEIEINEDMANLGVINFYTTEDGAYMIGVAEQTFDDLDAYLANEGAANIEYILINGIAALSYDVESEDSSYVMFINEEGTYGLSFGFQPISDESFAALAVCMMASFQFAD